MKRTYKIIAGVAAALSLAVAASVSAHPGGGFGGWEGMGPGGGWGMGPGGGWGMGPGGGWGMGPGWGPGAGFGMMSRGGPGDAGAWASTRAAQLKAELKITAAQEPAWKAFESALQQQAATMQAMRSQMWALMQNAQPGSTEFIAQRDAMIKQHDASFAARNTAFKELYAVLTPEQRAIADSGFGPVGGYHMRGWRSPR